MARKERVIRVIDDDTFETERRKHPVRLANVNAPEKGRPGAPAATQALSLSDLIDGEIVRIDTVARDKYRRSVANVRLGRRSVNRAMLGKTKK